MSGREQVRTGFGTERLAEIRARAGCCDGAVGQQTVAEILRDYGVNSDALGEHQ